MPATVAGMPMPRPTLSPVLRPLPPLPLLVVLSLLLLVGRGGDPRMLPMPPTMVSTVPEMLTPRATISFVSRPPPPLLLLVGPEVDVDMLEAPCAAEEVVVRASEDDDDKEYEDDDDVGEELLAAVVPAVIASPRLQYAAKTAAACIASGWGLVRQDFRMFVEIWSKYS